MIHERGKTLLSRAFGALSVIAAAGTASLVVLDWPRGDHQLLIWATAAHAVTTAFCAAAFKRGTRSAVGRALTGLLASGSGLVGAMALTFHPGDRYWLISAGAFAFWVVAARWLTLQFDNPAPEVSAREATAPEAIAPGVASNAANEPPISGRTDPPAELPPPLPQQPPMVRPVVHDAPSR
jgi:hypothetical protein